MQINLADPEAIEDHNLGVPQRDDSKRFKCGYCDFQTARSGNLKIHSRKHTGEMLQCQHCDYTTTKSRLLKFHSRKHTGENFHCQHCDYKTVYSSNLKRHSGKHTDKKKQQSVQDDPLSGISSRCT